MNYFWEDNPPAKVTPGQLARLKKSWIGPHQGQCLFVAVSTNQNNHFPYTDLRWLAQIQR